LAERVALVGSETLLGREIEEVLSRSVPRPRVTPYAASGEGNFGARDGEGVFVAPLDAAAVGEHRAIVVAGTREGARKAYELAKAISSPPKVIDCTGYLENEPEARMAATSQAKVAWLLIVPHPAAFAIAQVLGKLAQRWKIARGIVNVFEPASERGQRGITELQQQTAGLLAFKALDKKVFDAQLSFNLLAQYGEDAPVKLAGIERRIERDIATLLDQPREKNQVGSAPMPSVRLVQAPVFHGYSISLWVEFQTDCKTAELGEALASAGIDVRGAEVEAPTNVGAASQSGLLVGDIRMDQNNSRAAWLWIVCDNLRLRGDETARLLGALEGAKP
jgi:aspartate-semialdehyde dehydrogenase